MAQNLKDFYANAQTEPVLTTVGRGVREGGQGYAGAYNQVPKVLGVPAAGIANVFAQQLANLKTGVQGTPVKAPEYQALTFGQMADRTKATMGMGGAAPAAPAAPVTTKPGVLGPLPALNQQPPLAELNALPGIAGVKDWSGARVARTGWEPSQLPSAAQVASDKSRAASAQAASDARLGMQPAGAPAAIDVKRQANGVLSFTGSGGDGTGAVKYSGMPNWTSQRGGAGQGSVGAGFNLGEQNQRMAAALQGIQAMDLQKKADSLIDAMASGAGGAVGVAQNKAAMAALGPLIERQMANENALKTTGMTTATQARGQDLGLTGEMARVAATNRSTDVGASTADKQLEVEKQKAAAVIQAAREKAAAGKPTTLKDQTALFVFSGKNADGTPRTPAQQAALELRYAATFGNRDSYMGMLQGEEE